MSSWLPGQPSIAVVRDRRAGTVSIVLRVVGEGFPVASLREQDAMVGAWGAALAPLARARCAVSKVTWQEWAHPVGVAGHRQFLTETSRPSDTPAAADYEELLVTQAPFTIAHEVLLTVTVDLKRVRARRHSSQQAVAVETVTDEIRLLTTRLEAAGLQVESPLSPGELSAAIRLRSDPTRATQLGALRRSLASAVGRGAIEWGPMAVDADWFHTRVDRSVHRSYRVGSWPMLPVTADWLTPLLTGDGAVRTVTVVVVSNIPRSVREQSLSRANVTGDVARASSRGVWRERRTRSSGGSRSSAHKSCSVNG